MENRNGLVVDLVLTHATGTAEREATLGLLGLGGGVVLGHGHCSLGWTLPQGAHTARTLS